MFTNKKYRKYKVENHSLAGLIYVRYASDQRLPSLE